METEILAARPRFMEDSFKHSCVEMSPELPWQVNGTILLVEGEEQVKLVAKDLLRKLGFTVIEASNGKEALEQYEKYFAYISLVVTDTVMPIMDGYELFIELKFIDPELPIIISTSFDEMPVAFRIVRDDVAGIIRKPYNFEQVRELLKGLMSEYGR